MQPLHQDCRAPAALRPFQRQNVCAYADAHHRSRCTCRNGKRHGRPYSRFCLASTLIVRNSELRMNLRGEQDCREISCNFMCGSGDCFDPRPTARTVDTPAKLQRRRCSDCGSRLRVSIVEYVDQKERGAQRRASRSQHDSQTQYCGSHGAGSPFFNRRLQSLSACPLTFV